MKGSVRTTQFRNLKGDKTKFDDWSDPKCKPFRRKISKPRAPEQESSEPQELIEKPSVSSETLLEIEELRNKLRAGYPLLSLKEIRNVKLPFYESLLLNLKDDGFLSTYAFINELIILDETWHSKRDNDALIKNRPFLKFKPFALNLLSGGLTNAETANKQGNQNEELRSMLDLALHFSKLEDSWYWIAEELYEQCTEICSNKKTGFKGQLEAITKYLYAKFLLEAFHNLQEAKTYIEQSMQLSEGKSWNASEIVGEKCDILYFESCLLLHRIYIEMAHEERGFNIENAIQLCRSSFHWARQINCKPAEATSLINLVIVYLEAGRLDSVLNHLDDYMRLCKDQGDIGGLCEGYILLAMYHELTDQDELVIADIQNLLKVADENHIVKMIALAHRKLATFYLMQGNVKGMQYHAIEAYNHYLKLDSKFEKEESRCLTGLAQAQEIMSQYMCILLDAQSVDSSEFNTLMLWKALRIPFFTNVKLFQPEGEINSKLKDKLEVTKSEERAAATKIRQIELAASASLNRSLFKHPSRSSSILSSRMSPSVLNILKNSQMSSIMSSHMNSHSSRSFNFQKDIKSASKTFSIQSIPL